VKDPDLDRTQARNDFAVGLGRLVALMIASAIVGAGLASIVWLILESPGGPEAPIPLLLEAGAYVALGDSYSAGEGLPPWEPGTEDRPEGNRCHRSASDAYPVLIWWPEMTERRWRACSGALVGDIFDEEQTDGDDAGEVVTVPSPPVPQVESGLLGEHVSLVTITIGGNDVGFAKSLRFCGLLDPRKHCFDIPFDPYDEYATDPTLERWIDDRMGRLRERIADLYRRLREAAERARILVLGYPFLFPERVQATCLGQFGAYRAAERSAFIGHQREFTDLIQAEATAAGVEYVDVPSLFVTHEPCGRGGADWVRFPSPGRTYGWFHPNEIGQEKLARAVLCHLETYEPGGEATAIREAQLRRCFESSDVFPAPPLTSSQDGD
jgi:hypothetical protein